MIKSKKNKIILGVLAGAAVISLASVGFAQWQIGLVKHDAESKINVKVDTYAEETCYLNVKTASDASIKLGEIIAYNKGNGVGYVKETEEASLEVGIEEFTLIVSENNAKNKTPSLTFSLAIDDSTSTKSLTTNLTEDVDEFGRNRGEYSFIGLKQTITFSSFTDTTCFEEATNAPEGYKVFKLKNGSNKFEFNWGSLFGNTDVTNGDNSPATYYQTKIAAVDSDTSLTTDEAKIFKKLKMLNQVQKDLTAMHSSLDGACLKITINFSFK